MNVLRAPLRELIENFDDQAGIRHSFKGVSKVGVE